MEKSALLTWAGSSLISIATAIVYCAWFLGSLQAEDINQNRRIMQSEARITKIEDTLNSVSVGLSRVDATLRSVEITMSHVNAILDNYFLQNQKK